MTSSGGRVQQGFQYELNTAAFLQTIVTSASPNGVVLAGFRPAGAGSDRPDIVINFNGAADGLEMKISPASFGSLVIHYNLTGTLLNLGSRWQWGDVEGREEATFLRDVGNGARVLQTLTSNWANPPNLISDKQEWYEDSQLPALRERYNQDLANCPDQRFPVASSAISTYYNAKNTHYINLGSHGFYTLGSSDPLGLNQAIRNRNDTISAPNQLPEVPNWDDCHTAQIRCRCQSKGVTRAEERERITGSQLGGWGYQFTAEFTVSQVVGSPYNVAPISTGVTIDTSTTAWQHTASQLFA